MHAACLLSEPLLILEELLQVIVSVELDTIFKVSILLLNSSGQALSELASFASAEHATGPFLNHEHS